jgi:hypothetical protein
MREYEAEDFSDNAWFVDYWNDTDEADSVQEVEDYCKKLMDNLYDQEDWQEIICPAGYLMYKIAGARTTAEFPEALVSSDSFARKFAKKKLKCLKTGIKYETQFIDIWNYTAYDNGISHGTVMAMCLKSDKRELRSLGRKIWRDLVAIQDDEDIYFEK